MSTCLSLIALCALVPQDPPATAPSYELSNAFPRQRKFDKPLYIDHLPADPGFCFVVEQDGKVFRIPRDAESAEREVFLDWTGKVYRENWEEGLLGIAFDPDWKKNHFVYIDYSQKLDKGRRQSVISRLGTLETEFGPIAVPESEMVLMTIEQPYGNHNGGTILFGPDGMLYIALGDGGKANDPHGNGQNRKTLLGSVLRIDVRGGTADAPYSIPPDNPFVDEVEDGVRGEIWCYGMRNPWRISFDRETGDLWCGDVGQNAWEEVDRLQKGGNYGWNWREGKHPFELRKGEGEPPAGMLEPVAEYPREDGLSVTGGYVYRGKAMPELRGWYVYADFMTWRVWAVREDREKGKHEVVKLCTARSQVSSFAEEPDGELLVCCFNGRIYRLGHETE